MSYQERNVDYIGRYFTDSYELVNFLLQHNIVSQELVDTWTESLDDGERLTNILDPKSIVISNFPTLHDVDAVGGESSLFLGYIIETKLVSLKKFNEEVTIAKQKWKAIFNEDVELSSVIQYL